MTSTTSRAEAFSDGVLAIAITLLVLELRVPDVPKGSSLSTELLHLWPKYAVFAVSFVTIGIMWVNHHQVMDLIERTDHLFLLFNIGLLLCIAFVPFPTRLVAEHIRDEGARAAALTYGVTLTTTAVFFSAIWFRASIGRRLLRKDADQRVVTGITRSYLPGPWIYLGATLVAFISPEASAILYMAIALLYVVESSVFGRKDA